MKKSARIFAGVLVALMLTAMIPFCVSAEETADVWDGTTIATAFASGDGSEGNPYVISSAAEYIYFATSSAANDYAGKFIIQTKDIDLGGADLYTDAANYMVSGFKGNYNGACHTISNYKMTKKFDGLSEGLFSTTDGATIQGIIVEKATMTDVYDGGFIVGTANGNTVISACYVSDDCSISGMKRVAGIVGSFVGADKKVAKIEYCVNNAAVSVKSSQSNSYAAGIVTVAENAVLNYCGNYGAITSDVKGKDANKQSAIAAGIIAISGTDEVTSAEADVLNCVNLGAISNTNASSISRGYVGGICGKSGNCGAEGSTTFMTMQNCYNFGALINNSTNTKYNGYIAQITSCNVVAGHTVIKDCFGLDAVSTALATKYPSYDNGTNYIAGVYGTGEGARAECTNIGVKTENELEALAAPIATAIMQAFEDCEIGGNPDTGSENVAVYVAVAVVALVASASIVYFRKKVSD